MQVFPPDLMKQILILTNNLNDLMADHIDSEVYLSGKIDLMSEGDPLGVRLVDDGMGNGTYYLEFYDVHSNE